MTAIDDKYAALGAAGGVLGSPTSAEQPCPDGIGRFRHYQHGSIYWTPSTAAHEVHGAIHGLWSSVGWETSTLGYPTSDEMDTPHHFGRVSHFQHGSIYWDAGRGPYELFPRPAFAPVPAATHGRSIHCVSRSADKLDVFGTDVDGAIVTAAWEPSFTDGWHGWWDLKAAGQHPERRSPVCPAVPTSWMRSSSGWTGESGLRPGSLRSRIGGTSGGR